MNIPRAIHSDILKKLQPNKVVVIYGPRQVGKTTLLHHIMPQLKEDFLFLSGEDRTVQPWLSSQSIETLKEKEGFPDDYEARVHVSMSVTDEAVQITISDNGIGLPEDRSRLFEPYVTSREKGTGLGLPIVKKIIEEHGGTLTLVDAAALDGSGQIGAAAEIVLPLVAAQKETGGLAVAE